MASSPRRCDPEGLSRCAFYVAANGFGADASRLVCVSRAYAHGGSDDESFLSGLLLCEKRDVRAGCVVACPRLVAAAMVGDAARVRELVRAGADLHATDKRSHTCLIAAVSMQRVAVVRELLATASMDGALVRARVAAGLPNAGHSAYSIACTWAADTERELSEAERAAAAACVVLLAASPLQAPDDLGGSDCTALTWTCYARLPGVLSSWLADARCTRAVVTQRDADGHSAYSTACAWAADTEHKLSEAERAAAAACAALLAASPLQVPGDLGEGDLTALTWTCWARLPGVLSSWLADARCTRAVVTQRDADGHSAFSIACAWAADNERKLSEAERAAAAACVVLLAASPLQAPDDLGGSDATALSLTCYARLPGVLSSWLADARCTRAVVTQRDADGHSAYSTACAWAADTERKLSEAERAAAAACVVLLAASPLQAPDDLGLGDRTALTWTCYARLPGVLSSWLADARCTRVVMTQRDARGHSTYSIACEWAADYKHMLSEAERAAAAACATVLSLSPHIPPGASVDREGLSALLWACRARLVPVVAAWVVDARCTRAVLTGRAGDGESSFSAACLGSRDAARRLSDTERAASAACARAIAASPHFQPDDLGQYGGTALLWACWAGLPDVVAALLAHPLCTRAVMTARDEGAESPLSAACMWAGDARRVLAASERAAAAECAHLLAASPLLGPGDTSHAGRTALHSACSAGLDGIVSVWLADPRCTQAVVVRCDREGATAASALLKRLGAAERLTAAECRDSAACARALGGSPHLPAPLRAELEAAAASALAV